MGNLDGIEYVSPHGTHVGFIWQQLKQLWFSIFSAQKKNPLYWIERKKMKKIILLPYLEKREKKKRSLVIVRL